MSKQEKEDNFTVLLLELSKTISAHGQEDDSLCNHGTNESATSISNNI